MKDAVTLLKEMVAIPSVSCGLDGKPDDTHGEARMVEYVADFCDTHHIDYEAQEVEPGRENLIARVEGGAEPSLLLEAHTDTVEVENMTVEPFTPVEKNGRIYGRGSCDDKASLAVMMTGLVRAMESKPPRDIIFVAAADEECGFGGAKRLVESGFRADAAVVGEPTELRLVIAHKGACRTKVRTFGQTAHTSDPSKGKNAIYAMGQVILALRDYAESLQSRSPHPLVGHPTAALGMISGGQAPNIVPDLCEIVLDRRVIPGEDTDDVFAEIEAAVADGVDDTVQWEAELFLDDPTLETSADAPVAQLVARALDEVSGMPEPVGVQYGTDASKFAEAGIPSVVIGPGSIRQAHSADEFVEISQVQQAARIYERICTISL
ncbi:MAG: M20 family metallopeptidase [Armatimonadota bacterium]